MYLHWGEHNEGHVAAHRVEPAEVEEVLSNNPIHIETRMDARSGEERVLELAIPMLAAFCLWRGRLAGNSRAR